MLLAYYSDSNLVETHFILCDLTYRCQTLILAYYLEPNSAKTYFTLSANNTNYGALFLEGHLS